MCNTEISKVLLFFFFFFMAVQLENRNGFYLHLIELCGKVGEKGLLLMKYSKMWILATQNAVNHLQFVFVLRRKVNYKTM